MDRFSWAVAAVAIILFIGLVIIASVVTPVDDPPPVSCTGSSTCRIVPRPTFTDNPVPPPRSSPVGVPGEW